MEHLLHGLNLPFSSGVSFPILHLPSVCPDLPTSRTEVSLVSWAPAALFRTAPSPPSPFALLSFLLHHSSYHLPVYFIFFSIFIVFSHYRYLPMHPTLNFPDVQHIFSPPLPKKHPCQSPGPHRAESWSVTQLAAWAQCSRAVTAPHPFGPCPFGEHGRASPAVPASLCQRASSDCWGPLCPQAQQTKLSPSPHH